MKARRREGRWLILLCVGACGGKAVVDSTTSSGSGGEGGTHPSTTSSTPTGSTTSSTPTGSTTSTSDPCDALQADLEAKLQQALACNPMLSVEQCTGELVVYDTCGCVLAANALAPNLAQAANLAYQAWVAAGCGPWDCAWCPPEPPSPWFCSADPSGQTGQCEPLANG